MLSWIWRGVLTLAIVSGLVTQASAQGAGDWPNKTVRIIVNFGPGGSADNSMRPYAERLSKALGQQFVIENRGGASGALGLEAVVKAAPDGYTFGFTPSLSLVILPHLRKTPYDPLKDLVPVSIVTDGTLLFALHPSIPVKSVPEFVDYAKKNPGKLSWGTAGVGSFGHIMAESMKLHAGLDILHVPYRGGGESLADFLAGVHQIHADPNTMPHVAAGKANLLAVLDRKRHPDYPNVPLLKEIIPEMDYIVWFGLVAPPGTPPAIAKKFAEEIAKISKEPALEPILRKAALAPFGSTPEEMTESIKKDHAKFGTLINKLGIKAE
ncbi:MAG: Bug family tripartite tricarboxylate transporter substrate binding protein [Hyphomicrobiaceae bacterium]